MIPPNLMYGNPHNRAKQADSLLRQHDTDIMRLWRNQFQMSDGMPQWGDGNPNIVVELAGSGGTGCGCCDGFNCVAPVDATVGGCESAPEGAPNTYTIQTGSWTAFSALTPGGSITLNYVSGCLWTSGTYCVTEPSSSSSSSSSPVSGCYQWQAMIYTDSDGDPAFKCVPVLISGSDWMGIAETL